MQNIKLINPEGLILASAEVGVNEDWYEGTIDLQCTPASVRALFEEFEEIVNGQMFSFLDEIQSRVAEIGIKALFENGAQKAVRELQVFPRQGEVSFKLAEVLAASAGQANGHVTEIGSDLLPIKQ